MRLTADNFRPFSLRKVDRRKKQSLFNPYLFWGKRKSLRRISPEQSLYVDRFSAKEYLLVTSVLLLAVLDAMFTAIHLHMGATELNPLLNMILQDHGFAGLFLVKFGITIPCLFMVLLHIKYDVAQTGAKFLLFIYGVLNVYHLIGFTLQ